MDTRLKLFAAASLAAVLAATSIAQPQPTAPPPAQPTSRDNAPPAPRRDGAPGQPDGQRGPRDARPEGRPDPRPNDRQGQRAEPNPNPDNVEGAMKLMNRSLKRLRAQIDDPAKKEENLKLLGDIERACVIAKALPLPEPRKPRGLGDNLLGHPDSSTKEDGARQPRGATPRPADKPDAQSPGKSPSKSPSVVEPPMDRAKALTLYRQDLIKLMHQLLTMEEHLMADNLKAAKADVDDLIELRNSSHEELGIEKD